MKQFLPITFSRLRATVFFVGTWLLLFPLIGKGQTTHVLYEFEGGSTTPSVGSTVSTFSLAANISATSTTGKTGDGLLLSNLQGTYTKYCQFTVNAVNKKDLKIDFWQRVSSTGPTTLQLQYSTTGASGTFTAVSGTRATSTVTTGADIAQFDLSTITALNNNSSVVFRICFTGASSSSGTFRVDDLKVTATNISNNSTSSNIIPTPAGFNYTANIDYAANTGANVTIANPEVFGFDIQDGGGAPDADAVGSILNGITFTVTNPGVLSRIALYDGNTELAEVAAAASVSFSGLTISAADNDKKSLSLRATYSSTVTDNTQFSFTVSGTSTSATGSGFAAANAGAAVSSTAGDHNRIEVTASKFTFTTQPTNVVVNTVFSPVPVIKAQDANNNTDLDYAASPSITTTTGLGVVNSPAATFTAGSLSLSALKISQTGPATALVITEGSKTVTSNAFDVSSSTASTVSQIASSEATSISSLLNTPVTSVTDGVQVWQLKLADGDGTTDDADSNPTIYKKLTFTQGGSNTVTNWNTTLQSVAFFDGNTKIDGNPIITSSSIEFTPTIPIRVEDGAGSSKTISIRVSLNPTTGAVTDGNLLQLKLSILLGVTTEDKYTSSQVVTGNILVSSTSGNFNKIDVVATQLKYNVEPGDVLTSVAISPAVKVEATDINGNRDLGFTGTVSITATGAALETTPATASAVAGIATFSTLKFTAPGDPVTLTATTTSPAASVTSIPFKVNQGISKSSDIVANSTFGYPANINYATNTGTDVTALSLEVFQLDVRDGGGSADADVYNTILKTLTLSVTNSAILNRVALYDGPTEIMELAAGATLNFSGLTIPVTDDNVKTLSLRVTFKTTVTDKAQFSFTVTGATADVAGSGFTAANAGGATSSVSGNNNRIDVVATALSYTTSPPASAVVNTALTTTPVIKAVDSNTNVDTDYATIATVSNSGALGMTAITANFANGVFTFPASFKFSDPGTTTLIVSDNNLISAVSNNITVSGSIESVVQILGGEATTISSIKNETKITNSSEGVQVWQFKLNDGNGTADDADTNPTAYSSFKITQGTASNTVSLWNDVIETAAFFEGSNTTPLDGVISINPIDITFNLNTPLVVQDGAGTSKTISLRISLKKNPSSNQDGKLLQFRLTKANTAVLTGTSYSQLNTFDISSATGGVNKIDVVGTELTFGVQPSPVTTGAAITPAVTVIAKDIHGNTDTGYNGAVTLTSNGATLQTSPVTGTLASGITTFSGIRFSTYGTATLTAAANGATTANSNSFVVSAGNDQYSYQSQRSGNWNTITPGSETWKRSLDGLTWAVVSTSGELPNSGVNTITIKDGHEVTVTSNTTADQVTVELGGILTVNASQTLTIADGAGTDLTVNGTLYIIGTATLNTGSNVTVNGILRKSGILTENSNPIAFNAGSVYKHEPASAFGVIPAGTWDVESTLEILKINGATSVTNASGLKQSFGNFKWNCPHSSSLNLTGILPTRIQGNFEILNTNSSSNYELRLTSATGYSLIIDGNLKVSGTSILSLANSTGSGTFAISLGGNLQIDNGGTLKYQNSTAPLTFSFNGFNKTFTNNGTINDAFINWMVEQNAYLTLATNLSVATGRALTVNGYFNTVNNLVTGAGAFNLNATGTLGIGSPDGISASGSTGNIQNTGTTRNFGIANYIYNGSTAQVTGNGIPNTVKGLSLNNDAGLTLSKTVAVNGILELADGVLKPSTFGITVNSGGSVTPPASTKISFVEGQLAHKANAPTTLFFPLGKGVNYRLVSLKINATDGENTYTAEQIDSKYPLPVDPQLSQQVDRISAIRYFTISKFGSNFVDASVTLNYDLDDKVTDSGNLAIVKYDATDGWAYLGGSGSANGKGEITSERFTTFSDFILANKVGGSNPLPVELLSFKAKAINSSVQLTWETASEKNNDFFVVERSTNGETFEQVAKVSGNGTSSTMHYYKVIDNAPVFGLNYYRLKQVDLDGTFAYSKVVTAHISEGQQKAVLYPNPAAEQLAVSFAKPSEKVVIRIINLLGQELMVKEAQKTDLVKIDVQHLPAGTYQVVIDGNQYQEVQKFIKLRN